MYALEQFVQQVAVAMLDVDEVEARALGDDRGRDEVADEIVELRVGEDLDRADTPVEERMRVGALRLRGALGPRPAPRMRELQPDEAIGIVAERTCAGPRRARRSPAAADSRARHR